jgi:hypothetical protein
VDGIAAGFGDSSRNSLPTSKLRVALFHVTQPLHEHLDRNVFVVSEQVALCTVPPEIDKRISVGGDSGETGEDVAEAISGISPSMKVGESERGRNMRMAKMDTGTYLFSRKIFSPPPPIHASAPSPPIPEPPGARDRSRSLPVTFYVASAETRDRRRSVTERNRKAWKARKRAHLLCC